MDACRLKQLRLEHGYSKERLAERLSVPSAMVSAYESGSKTPELEILIALSELFEISLDYLVGLSTERESLKREETGHMRLYRMLSKRQKDNANAYIQGMLDAEHPDY